MQRRGPTGEVTKGQAVPLTTGKHQPGRGRGRPPEDDNVSESTEAGRAWKGLQGSTTLARSAGPGGEAVERVGLKDRV